MSLFKREDYTTPFMENLELGKKVLNHIETHPERHLQSNGAYCILGWTEELADGNEAYYCWDDTETHAVRLLGIDRKVGHGIWTDFSEESARRKLAELIAREEHRRWLLEQKRLKAERKALAAEKKIAELAAKAEAKAEAKRQKEIDRQARAQVRAVYAKVEQEQKARHKSDQEKVSAVQ